MNNGTVQLSSGCWDWNLETLLRGARVVFRRRGKGLDEMHNWIASTDVFSQGDAEQNALDPISRIWTDGFGSTWKVIIEYPTIAMARGNPDTVEIDPVVGLVFERGICRLTVPVPASTRLGELTHSELLDLLELAI